jgi:predicted ATPase
MHLVSFSVENYRSITTAYKLPIKQTTILVGPNNEGKSNILRALVTSLEVLASFAGRRITPAGRIRYYVAGESYNWANDFPISLQSKYPKGESTFYLEFRLDASEIADFHQEVKSNLNGNLPIKLTLGREDPGFKVIKKGPGGPALSRKAALIANFVAKRININYIPAIRTSEAAEDIVGRMVERALTTVEREPAYKNALAEVSKLQEPLLESISEGILKTLKQFLPNVKRVKVTIPTEARYRALRRVCEIIVDDGTPTHLSRKGDGVQSLAALSLMRQVSEASSSAKQLILAIEEPESHLHPNAIHQLKKVIGDIAKTNQVIMTTHCPLFVDRVNIRSNIIVHNNRAVPAKNVSQLREVLGVRASDNLQNAELILVVEGEEDRRALRALLSTQSKKLQSALNQGALAIESLQGGSNLSYKLSQIRESLCLAHSFLDHDACGLAASNKAQDDGLLELADIHFTVCQGFKESEIEDLYDEDLYRSLLLNKYGVSVDSPKFKGNAKWSDRARAAFGHQGKPWSERIEAALKTDVATLVEGNPSDSLNLHKRPAFDALVGCLEAKLSAIEAGKKREAG